HVQPYRQALPRCHDRSSYGKPVTIVCIPDTGPHADPCQCRVPNLLPKPHQIASVNTGGPSPDPLRRFRGRSPVSNRLPPGPPNAPGMGWGTDGLTARPAVEPRMTSS